MTPDEIANIDGSPDLTVIKDFCRDTKGFFTSLPSAWEPIEEHLLDTLHVPGEPDIVPHKAWCVMQGDRKWMIYMWYENSSFDSDTYVYEQIR
jgi:hypothetical protein